MRYLPKSESDREVMLREIGAKSIDDLFAAIPAEYRLKRDLNIPRAYAESEIVEFFRQRAAESAQGYATFLGAGAYSHYRPVVVDSLVSRGEFFTAYTPYQPEIAQGTLQSIFEFQTMICELTGMDVANASMYDGSTGAAEALMMAARITGRHKSVVASSVHPEYREVITTYARYQGMPISTVGYLKNGRVDLEALDKAIDNETAGVLIQSPNFFGTIEDVAAVGEIVHKKGALLIVSIAEAVSLGIVKPPVEGRHREHGSAIIRRAARLWRTLLRRDGDARQVCAPDARTPGGRNARPQRQARIRADAFHPRTAHPSREGDLEHLHQPGAGRADVLHLHDGVWPRRTEGPGKAEPGESALRRRTSSRRVGATLLFEGAPRFNEFVIQTKSDPYAINDKLLGQRIIGGFPLKKFYPELGNASLWCCTETTTKASIDAAAKEVAL